MSDLIVIGFDNPATAREASRVVSQLNQDMIVQLNGLAVVTVDDKGKLDVETPFKITGVSASTLR